MTKIYLTPPQFKAELEKCLQCPHKPCLKACPVKCSPHDFIAAAKAEDIKQAAELIATQNPLGEVCGLICPEKFCMHACLRQHIDAPIKIPAVQAEIMHRARQKNMLLHSAENKANGKKVAVIGLGPSGIGAVSELIKYGFQVEVFEKENTAGGALNLIPAERLPREVIAYEWQKLAQNPLVEAHFNSAIENYEELLTQGFAAVIVTKGEQKKRTLGIEGEDLAVKYVDYLKNPQKYATSGAVAIVGGGAVAADCALLAVEQGAKQVEMFVRRRSANMKMAKSTREELIVNNVDITAMTRLVKIERNGSELNVYTCKTRFDADNHLQDVPETTILYGKFAVVVLALGSTRDSELKITENIYYAGDFANGSTTAVEALASGKQTAAELAQKIS